MARDSRERTADRHAAARSASRARARRGFRPPFGTIRRPTAFGRRKPDRPRRPSRRRPLQPSRLAGSSFNAPGLADGSAGGRATALSGGNLCSSSIRPRPAAAPDQSARRGFRFRARGRRGARCDAGSNAVGASPPARNCCMLRLLANRSLAGSAAFASWPARRPAKGRFPLQAMIAASATANSRGSGRLASARVPVASRKAHGSPHEPAGGGTRRRAPAESPGVAPEPKRRERPRWKPMPR